MFLAEARNGSQFMFGNNLKIFQAQLRYLMVFRNSRQELSAVVAFLNTSCVKVR